jgi:hypothetical protein
MTAMRRKLVCAVFVVALGARAVCALAPYGPLQITGNLQSQTLIRHPDIDQYQFIQNRNTLRLRLDYEFLKDGRLIEQVDLPWVRSSHLFLLYRGIYDSVYDIAPGGNLHDIFGAPVGKLADLSHQTRDGLKYQNVLREAYVDVDFRSVPLSLRLGRQQVVWGETDNFRMLDRANPLDLTWHQVYESWDDLRIPLWMIKALWRINELGPLSDTFVETYWNPGDWAPAKQGFMPDYPWGIPTENPLTPVATLLKRRSLFHGTTLFDQGDYTRNPGDNSQVGVRFSAVTPQGIQFSLNYFYQRWAGDDGTNYAPVRALTDLTQIKEANSRNEIPAEFIAPYVHTAGLSINYSEEEYTQTVYRLESVYDFGVPFSDKTKNPPVQSLLRNQAYGVTKRDMWKGMVGFDRPTWIRPLNRTSTFFLSGQFFWHWLIDREPSFIGNIDPAGHDKLREFETIFTLAATTFYAGGTIIPTVSCGLDPIKSYNMYVGWTLDYFLTNQLIARVGQNFFLAAGKQPAFESWSLGGLNRGRSESVFRLTYQF